eukprot:gene10421-13998_t
MNCFIWKAGFIVGSGGLIFGYDIGIISSTLGDISNSFHLNDFQAGIFVGILYAGAVLGSLIGGPLCDYFGRWRVIHIQNIIFVLGAIITGGANHYYTLCVGRFVVGIAAALSGIADIPYLTEIAPAEYRGMLTGQYEILVCVGVLASYISGLLFSTSSNGWRYALIIPSIFAILQSIGMCFLPETPKWLIRNNLLKRAELALIQIYGYDTVHNYYTDDISHNHTSTNSHDANHDIIEYRLALDRIESNNNSNTTTTTNNNNNHIADKLMSPDVEEEISPTPSSPSATTSSIYHYSGLKHRLQRSHTHSSSSNNSIIFAQFTGGVVIRNYAPLIFSKSGISTHLSLLFNVILGYAPIPWLLSSEMFPVSIRGMDRDSLVFPLSNGNESEDEYGSLHNNKNHNNSKNNNNNSHNILWTRSDDDENDSTSSSNVKDHRSLLIENFAEPMIAISKQSQI